MAANIFTATGCNIIIIIIIILIINSLLKKVQYMNFLQRKYRNCIKIEKKIFPCIPVIKNITTYNISGKIRYTH